MTRMKKAWGKRRKVGDGEGGAGDAAGGGGGAAGGGPHLAAFPPGGAAWSPVIFAVSLGPREAMIEFAGRALAVRGLAALAGGAAKNFIELTKLAELAGSAAAEVFWTLADAGAGAAGAALAALGAPALANGKGE